MPGPEPMRVIFLSKCRNLRKAEPDLHFSARKLLRLRLHAQYKPAYNFVHVHVTSLLGLRKNIAAKVAKVVKTVSGINI